MSKKPDLSGYNYGAISSLVLTTDRSALPRRDKEPDGAPVSLAGRIDPKDMGSRVIRQAPKDLDKKKRKAVEGVDEKASSKRTADIAGYGYADIIEATQDVEGLTYRPRTAETRQVYELMLSAVHTSLGDQAQDIVRSAADTVLETLKNEGMKDFDKKKEIEEVVGPVSNEQFSQLVNLSKKITDYNADDEAMADPDQERKDAEIDEEGGVAVVFDEEEQEEEDEEGFEIREESDSDEEDEEKAADEEVEAPEDEDDDLVIGGEATTKIKTEKDVVSPHSVDGFWVQRQISEVYPDPVTAADKAASVLSILASESSARDCENQLMELFDYESFHIITKFLKNRDVVVWCTKLMRSDADERVNVEVAMREKGLGWILRDLAGDRQTKASIMPKLKIPSVQKAVRKVWQLFRKPTDDSPQRNVQAPEVTIQDDDNGDISSSSTSQEEADIPRNILAFRTITKMLEAIQQKRIEFEALPADSELTDEERSELKISNAFATLAVIEHEVVAVATSRHSKLEILVSIRYDKHNSHKPSKRSDSAKPPPSTGSTSVIFVQNFRRSKPLSAVSPTENPFIFDAKNLASIDLDGKTLATLDLEGDEGIRKYVGQYWSHSTMARHLWILSKLLNQKGLSGTREPITLSNRILPYVIATCFPKMNHRMNNKDVSQLYIESLQDIEDVIFNQSNIAKKVTSKETANDRQFLRYVLDTSAMRAFESPKLMEQAELAGRGEPFQLYTEDTCNEFHKLLVHIVVQFRISLSALVTARNEARKQNQPTMGSQKFEQKVHRVLLLGYALQRLTKGASLKVHLKNIALPLQSYRLRPKPSTRELGDQQGKEPGDEKQVEEEDYEIDDDLTEVQPDLNKSSSLTPLWLYCFNWLKLMITYFDAVDILVGYVTSPVFTYEDITIRILGTPFVDNRLLPWRELFIDSTLFPTFTEQYLAADPKGKVKKNADILAFLKEALETSSEAAAAKKLWDKGDIPGTIAKFGKMKSSNIPGWAKFAAESYDKLKQLPRGGPVDDDMDDEISEVIQSLCDSAQFINSLNDKHGFTGSPHCEACLASFLHEAPTASKDSTLKDYGPLIGVSKRCCPVCYHLLFLLGNGKFRVRGFHNTVTACTLPSGLPAYIVDSMNQYFGAQLRKELLDFIDLPRIRTQSSGSEKSSDSTGQFSNHVTYTNSLQIIGVAAQK